MSAGRRTACACIVLLAFFTAIAWSAVLQKTPTADEPCHAAAGWLNLRYGEFRSDSEHPPLWKYWANLPNLWYPLHCDPKLLHWEGMPLGLGAELVWQTYTLYHTPGNDAIGFVRRCRAMMLAVGVALGALVGGFTWLIAQSIGARARAAGMATIIASALFSFDPNFLAHAPLMKNDVATALTMLAMTACVWAVGRRLSVARVLSLGLICAVALGVKYTGILIALMAIGLLLIRALLPSVWTLGNNRSLARRAHRLIAAVTVTGIVLLMCYAGIWLSYGLRFAPAGDGRTLMDLSALKQTVLVRHWQAAHAAGPLLPTPKGEDLVRANPPLLMSLAEFAERHRLLPQAWISGFLFTLQGSMIRRCYLCGQISWVGWWSYFPLAMLVKTPLATLAASMIALVLTARAICLRDGVHPVTSAGAAWTRICVAVPPLLYFAAAMMSPLDLGVRYVLAVYPFAFIAIGLGLGRAWERDSRRIGWTLFALGMALSVECISALPDFIPFFNAAAGGSRGGLKLLSDSNIDWGQDIGLLSLWQREHPQTRLYYCCVGPVDPAYFGLKYVNTYSGYLLGPPAEPIEVPGVMAISASKLQGLYAARDDGRPFYDWLQNVRPMQVLGGSIYLFRIPPEENDRLPAGKWLTKP